MNNIPTTARPMTTGEAALDHHAVLAARLSGLVDSLETRLHSITVCMAPEKDCDKTCSAQLPEFFQSLRNGHDSIQLSLDRMESIINRVAI